VSFAEGKHCGFGRIRIKARRPGGERRFAKTVSGD